MLHNAGTGSDTYSAANSPLMSYTYVVVTSAGVSVGDHDYVKEVLEDPQRFVLEL